MFPRAPRAVRAVQCTLLAGVVVHLAHGVLGVGGGVLDRAIEDGLYNALLMGAALLCAACARSGSRGRSSAPR